jgi:hypothetical protein
LLQTSISIRAFERYMFDMYQKYESFLLCCLKLVISRKKKTLMASIHRWFDSTYIHISLWTAMSQIYCIKTYDFSTVYTTIPHVKLKSWLFDIIGDWFSNKNGKRNIHIYLSFIKNITLLITTLIQCTSTSKMKLKRCWNSSSTRNLWQWPDATDYDQKLLTMTRHDWPWPDVYGLDQTLLTLTRSYWPLPEVTDHDQKLLPRSRWSIVDEPYNMTTIEVSLRSFNFVSRISGEICMKKCLSFQQFSQKLFKRI